MKHIQRGIALSSLLLLFTVSSVFAQSDRQTVVNIPFSFVVGDKALPAGKYIIRRNRRDSDTAWVITRKDGGANVVILTIPARSNDTQQDSKLVFHRYDDLYFLSGFWTAGGNTGREIQLSNRERNLDNVLALKRQEIILSDRGR